MYLALALLVAFPPSSARAQGVPLPVEDMPLVQHATVASGATVTPVYEGWYENPGGSRTLYFGYYNRNTHETVHVPLGADNRIEGAVDGQDQGQPTRFEPGRHWGVFGVTVPPGPEEVSVTWRLRLRGEVFEIPGEPNEDWVVPAITGDAMGNLPPTLRLEEGGPSGFGPAGVHAAPRRARVGEAVELTVHASDDGTATSGRPGAEAGPVSLAWFTHRGPTAARFESPAGTVPNAGGSFETRVTFLVPGTYVLRVRANDDSGLAPAGHEQCCWTNGFVPFEVTP